MDTNVPNREIAATPEHVADEASVRIEAESTQEKLFKPSSQPQPNPSSTPVSATSIPILQGTSQKVVVEQPAAHIETPKELSPKEILLSLINELDETNAAAGIETIKKEWEEAQQHTGASL